MTRSKRGCITPKGYQKYQSKMVHRLIWVQYHGAIPPGYFVHHKDGNKKNNTLDNLALVSKLTHKRLHSGCTLVNGVWFKLCKACGISKNTITDFYKIKNKGISTLCKQCYIKKVLERRNEKIS